MKNTLDKLYSIFFILLGLSIPLSIAASNICIGVIVCIWIIEGDIKKKWKRILSSKWMSSILLLIILYCLGIIWGDIGVGKFQTNIISNVYYTSNFKI